MFTCNECGGPMDGNYGTCGRCRDPKRWRELEAERAEATRRASEAVMSGQALSVVDPPPPPSESRWPTEPLSAHVEACKPYKPEYKPLPLPEGCCPRCWRGGQGMKVLLTDEGCMACGSSW